LSKQTETLCVVASGLYENRGNFEMWDSFSKLPAAESSVGTDGPVNSFHSLHDK